MSQDLKTDYKLPVKNFNPDNSVKERMTENAYERILPARYLIKDENGEVTETPEELFERVATNVAQPDKEYEDADFESTQEEFEKAMKQLKFMPNSPTLMNAGDELQQLSACFVIHPEDSMESIFQKVKDASLIFKSGGGMGYPFHLLRPKGDYIESTGGVSSGPLSFMEVFDTTCGSVKQGGKRRGAQMAIMRVDHPDILRFIVSKRREGDFSNFNISVGLTDDFMEAVKNDETYELINPKSNEQFEVAEMTAQFYNRDEDWYPQAEGSDSGKDDNFWRDFAHTFGEEIDEYDINLEPGEPMELPARFIWETLIDGAWRNGEPGLFMYDETNEMHSFDIEKHPEKKVEATNPCGEQPLMNYEACNLGHINLSLMVEDKGDGKALHWDEFKEKNPSYDYEDELGVAVRDFLVHALDMEEFERIAKLGTHFLDNVVTMSDFPLEQLDEVIDSHRKVGLGLMGYAQMLMQLGVPYGNEVSQEIAEEIQRLITKWSVEKSNELAQERGEFSEWNKSKWANPTEYPEWFKKYSGGMNPEDWEDGIKLRNHNTTTIAPTGTTSMIGDTSGGCEPIFSLAYFKNVAKDIQGEDMLVEFDDYFLRTLEANGVDVEEVKEEAEELMRNNEWDGVDSISDEKLPQRVKEVFKTADTVTAEEHIDIQAAFQKYNHSGISKTCNFPNSATKEDVRKAYQRAYDKGIKGMTVYRDGTRDVQVMTTRQDNKLEDMEAKDLKAEIEDRFGGVDEFMEEVGVELEVNQSGDGFKKRERPKTLTGVTEEIETPYGDMFVTVNVDENGRPFEVFARIGKAGGYTQSFTEALSRSISASLRAGIDPSEVVDQLEGIRSPQVSWDKGEQVVSVPDGVAKALRRSMNGNNPVKDQTLTQENIDEDEPKDAQVGQVEKVVQSGENPECPECDAMLQMEEGCMRCEQCGYSKCG